MEAKKCSICDELKLVSEFHKNVRNTGGLDHRCKECRRARYLADVQRNREKALEYRSRYSPEDRKWQRIKAHYKLTRDQYIHLIEKQSWACAICQHTLALDKNTHVDHNHECCPGPVSCGKCVRGLLCSECNHLLGKAKDSKNTLLRAAEYLTRYEDIGEKYGTQV